MEHPPGVMETLLGPGHGLRRLMGLWQSPGRLSHVFSGLMAGVTLACSLFLALCAALKLCVDTPTELEQVTLCCLVSTVCTGFLVRVSLFMAQGDKLRHILGLLAETRAQFCSDDQNEVTRRQYNTMSTNIFYNAQMTVIPALIAWTFCPLLSHIFMKTDQENQEMQRQLPMPIWLPVDIHETPVYECLYVAQAFALLFGVESCLNIDIFLVNMMLMLAAEVEVLNCNISAIRDINIENLGFEREEFISRYKINDRQLALSAKGQSLGEQVLTEDTANEWRHQQLVKNVLHHREILRCVSLLQSAMNVSIFSMLFVNMANICSSLFVASVLFQKEGTVGKSLNALFTIPGQLYEVFIYCIYGQLMTDQSEKLMYSAFSCGWVNSDTHFKRKLIIFMKVTNRPIMIKVGKTCTLSKQMLIQVLNGTYGLLNMLCNMH